MRDPLDGIALFVEVVNAGGFSRAAEQLALTRSAVGKAIARVEERLGVRLFHRTTRTQSLTEDGQLYYEHCLRALEEVRSAQSLIESGMHEIAGRMRVTMPALFGQYCATPLLMEQAREHPKLELDLHLSDQSVDLIAEGFDLAIRFGPLSQLNGLQAQHLAVQQKLLCASPAYLAEKGHPRTIAQLMDHKAVLYHRRDYTQTWPVFDMDGQLKNLSLAPRIRLNDLSSIADAVEAGMGVGWLPSWLIRDRLRSGAIVQLLENHPPTTMDCHAVWPQMRQMPKRLRHLIDVLATRLPEVMLL
ncbi:transcriptional regulator [Pseudomonas cichorii]|uniref:Transcriptional regulator n=1 Tax=Pseudomonas cichorii TaxID=36746 RepID=A0ABQ1DRT0_PSECI|nr:LysR family transcriptional regulator [Pseudomonas cichorii]AHF67911.1 LysR family transcriptional regulator [Pseudomonas cichorii JBC1]QVE14986.1 LysR family transcriptional regulator [Pseudomonas cichorii]SDO67323.1 DNA-binding transcriptional regulator, LysR family [Pseudomonas cichorii]GFM89442.1 transcriptional regulator [Pseudomonas cichorii]GFM93735.1 transcriptional regulator [Pseudomonas cichorii]